MIVMSLKFGGYKVTEKDIGTMIEKKLESTEDKVPVFYSSPIGCKNEQKTWCLPRIKHEHQIKLLQLKINHGMNV